MENNEENLGTHLVHHCKGFIENVHHLSLSRETSQRAGRCGFDVVDFANSCLKTISHNVKDNSYDDIAKIIDVFADAARLFLKKYQIKDIELTRFRSSDSQVEFTVYLSNEHSGYILVKEDESREPSVRVTNGNEIWRYLGEPIYIIETVISVIVAYAERHQSIKEKWFYTLEDIEEISRE